MIREKDDVWVLDQIGNMVTDGIGQVEGIVYLSYKYHYISISLDNVIWKCIGRIILLSVQL
jgi:hypothetical protein